MGDAEAGRVSSFRIQFRRAQAVESEAASGLSSLVDLYADEIVAIERVLAKLNEKVATHTKSRRFPARDHRSVLQHWADRYVKAWETNVPGWFVSTSRSRRATESTTSTLMAWSTNDAPIRRISVRGGILTGEWQSQDSAIQNGMTPSVRQPTEFGHAYQVAGREEDLHLSPSILAMSC